MEPRSTATVDDMRNVVSKVNSLEEEMKIAPWDEEKIPEEVVNEKPTPGYPLVIIFSILDFGCLKFSD